MELCAVVGGASGVIDLESIGVGCEGRWNVPGIRGSGQTAGNSADSLQSGGRTILESESNSSSRASPGKVESLAGSNGVEGWVGELNSLCDNEGRSSDEEL